MPQLYLHKDEHWWDLLDDPEDIVYAVACRILPGQSRVITNGASPYARQEFIVHRIEYGNSFPVEATPTYFSACGQEVVAIIYEKRVKKKLFQSERPKLYHVHLVAAIGMHNRQVVTDTRYNYWDGEKHPAPASRKALMMELILYYVEHLNEFAHWFTPVTEESTGRL